MNLLRLLNDYKDKLYKIFSFYSKNKKVVPISFQFIIALCFGIMFSLCEEKIPTIEQQNESNTLVNIEQVVLTSEDLTCEGKDIEPNLSDNNKLYIGQNSNAESYALIKFDDFSSLPDTLLQEDILSVTMSFYTSSPLPLDTIYYDSTFSDFPELDVSLLKSNGAANWTDSSSLEYSYCDGLQKELLFTTPGKINSYITEDISDSIIYFWRKDSLNNFGILLKKSDGGNDLMQPVYSKNSSLTPYISVTYLTVSAESDTADTVSVDLQATDDVSVIKFTEPAFDTPNRIYLVADKYSGFFNFDISSVMPDSQAVIGRAELELKIDTLETEDYGSTISLNICLLDSTEWYPGVLKSQPQHITSLNVLPSDTSVVFSLENTIQRFLSGYHDNLGMVIYVDETTSDISVLSLMTGTSPRLNLVIMEFN